MVFRSLTSALFSISFIFQRHQLAISTDSGGFEGQKQQLSVYKSHDLIEPGSRNRKGILMDSHKKRKIKN